MCPVLDFCWTSLTSLLCCAVPVSPSRLQGRYAAAQQAEEELAALILASEPEAERSMSEP